MKADGKMKPYDVIRDKQGKKNFLLFQGLQKD